MFLPSLSFTMAISSSAIFIVTVSLLYSSENIIRRAILFTWRYYHYIASHYFLLPGSLPVYCLLATLFHTEVCELKSRFSRHPYFIACRHICRVVAFQPAPMPFISSFVAGPVMSSVPPVERISHIDVSPDDISLYGVTFAGDGLRDVDVDCWPVFAGAERLSVAAALPRCSCRYLLYAAACLPLSMRARRHHITPPQSAISVTIFFRRIAACRLCRRGRCPSRCRPRHADHAFTLPRRHIYAAPKECARRPTLFSFFYTRHYHVDS